MPPVRSIVAALIIGAAFLPLAACDKSNSGSPTGAASSGSGGGLSGVFTSVTEDEIRIEFKSGNVVMFSMGPDIGTQGTYTIDGEKVIVTMDGQSTTFIRDGDCIQDALHVFGKMCKGGAAGAAGNVTTRTPPPTTGTWVATNEDGEFTIEFKPGNKLAMTMKPSDAVPNGRPETQDGTLTIEGDTLYITLANSTPVVLKWVNGAYESTAFGLPMKFVKR